MLEHKKRYMGLIGSLLLVLILGIGFIVKHEPNPFHSQPNSLLPSVQATRQSIIVDDNDFQTVILKKPRDKIIIITVEKGDTLGSLAEKFGVSVDTIKWANGITSDTLIPGQTLQILPVTGIAYKVIKGDSIESLALKYHTDKQKIIDFPFNEFSSSQKFSLIPGAIIIIPDGSLP